MNSGNCGFVQVQKEENKKKENSKKDENFKSKVEPVFKK